MVTLVTKARPNILYRTKARPNILYRTKARHNVLYLTRSRPTVLYRTKVRPNILYRTKVWPNALCRATTANKGNIDHMMCQSEILHRRCPVEDWVFFINHFWVSKLFSADTRANFGRLKDPWPRSRPPNSETRF